MRNTVTDVALTALTAYMARAMVSQYKTQKRVSRLVRQNRVLAGPTVTVTFETLNAA